MTCVRETAILCVAMLIGPQPGFAVQEPPSQPGTQAQSPSLSTGQLDSLVAPLALYPDPILSQVLVASTYPLEIVEAARWVKQNPNLQGKDLVAAAAKQPWDASVQAMVAFPDLLTRLNDNLSWTTDLGNAFLAQQDSVMEAIQRMRQKASQSGTLTSNPQQTVSTTREGDQTYIEIQPTNPEVVYVPTYEPEAIWGPPVYPYPAFYYPPGAAIAAGAIGFGVGVAVGAFWGGGWNNWGWHCGWGHNNVVVNNNFINNNHFNHVNVANGNRWVHNPAHRDGVPYANHNVANRFNGMNGNHMNRPTAAQTEQRFNQMQQQHGGANGLGGRGAENRMGPGNAGQPGRGMGPAQGGANRMAPQGMGGDRIGNRSVGGGGGHGAFGGTHDGGFRTQMNSMRGFGSRGGGGMRMGGGGGRRR